MQVESNLPRIGLHFFMAKLPGIARQFSTGGNNSKSYYLTRDGNVIQAYLAATGVRQEFVYETVQAAKRAMNNPSSICK